MIGVSGGLSAFLRIGRGSVGGCSPIRSAATLGGNVSGQGCWMSVGGGGSTLTGVLQRRCGCCLVCLTGVAGGFLAGRDWRGLLPAEGAGLDLRLAFFPTDSTLKLYSSLVQHGCW